MKKTKEYRALEALVSSVEKFLRALDAEMKKPEGFGRGKRIAAMCNALEMHMDSIRFNELGIDFRTGKRRLASTVSGVESVRINPQVAEKVRAVLKQRGFRGY